MWFSAHCINQNELKYDITPNEKGNILTITKRRDGRWYVKGLPMGCGVYYLPSTKPIKFYDYNF